MKNYNSMNMPRRVLILLTVIVVGIFLVSPRQPSIAQIAEPPPLSTIIPFLSMTPMPTRPADGPTSTPIVIYSTPGATSTPIPAATSTPTAEPYPGPHPDPIYNPYPGPKAPYQFLPFSMNQLFKWLFR